MEKITWSTIDYKVKYRSEEIVFLPKEFQLFTFLYQNPSRIFTREQLLEAVWPMEAPVDRTVDDHIYRIRKKLQPFSSVVTIETVRGQGYLLSIHEGRENPLVKDQEVSSHVSTLFKKYHLFGQGDALRLLEENQSVLGFELDSSSLLYLHFMKGDFSWFIENEEVPFWEKCFYYIHIYSFAESDKKKCLDYLHASLAAKELPEYHRKEITLLNRLPLLIFTKRTDEAANLLIQSKKVVQEQKMDGFIPNLALIEGYLALVQGDARVIEATLDEIKNFLENYPFSREKASFSVIQGLYHLSKMDEEKAEYFFNEGFHLLREAKFIPGAFMNLHTILFFLEEFDMKGRLYIHYQALRKRYAEEYDLPRLKARIEHQLHSYLRR